MVVEKRHICIVDDDESICRALKLLLLTFGFEVSTFPSAEEYFKNVQAQTEGYLIADIHMSGMDGWGVLDRVVKSGSNLPVIIISANKSVGLKEKALKLGAAGFFVKPVGGQELVDFINKIPQKKKIA